MYPKSLPERSDSFSGCIEAREEQLQRPESDNCVLLRRAQDGTRAAAARLG